MWSPWKRTAWRKTRPGTASGPMTGVWNVRLTEEPTVFSVSWKKEGEGAWGKRFDLQDWDGIETAITGIQWQADGMLLLTCETADGGASKVLFDVETGSLQTLSSGTPRQETELQRKRRRIQLRRFFEPV